MTVHKRNPDEPELRSCALPPATVYLDDLQVVVNEFKSLGAHPQILTEKYSVDDVSDLRELPSAEATRTEIIAERPPLRFVLGPESTQLTWDEREFETVRSAVDAIRKHWTTIKRSAWVDAIYLIIVLVGYFLFLTGLFSLFKGEVRTGLSLLGVSLALGIGLTFLVSRNRGFVVQFKPAGPSLWQRNRVTLSENLLVIIVTLLATLLVSVPVTIAVTLLLDGH